MVQYTPKLQLETLFVLNDQGRIVSTREPAPSRGPLFCLIRGHAECVWAIHEAVCGEIAGRLEFLACDETPGIDLRSAPRNAGLYQSLLAGRVESGPTFCFPESLAEVSGLVSIDDLDLLQLNFEGWSVEEIPGRKPMLAVIEDGQAVSICFCARRSEIAAEAGLETATKWRGRGYAVSVTAAWAQAVRSCDLFAMYSTSWSNSASRSVARKLGLLETANHWSLY